MRPTRPNKPEIDEAMLIAPCGMNCRLCRAFMRKRNGCPGCRGDDRGKPKTRAACQIKTCRERVGKNFCYTCDKFPCECLSRLDQRYRKNYGMSMIANLRAIETKGLEKFLGEEKSKWSCVGCGATICVHEAHCPACKRKWR